MDTRWQRHDFAPRRPQGQPHGGGYSGSLDGAVTTLNCRGPTAEENAYGSMAIRFAERHYGGLQWQHPKTERHASLFVVTQCRSSFCVKFNIHRYLHIINTLHRGEKIPIFGEQHGPRPLRLRA